jgi:hypothetical protein
VSGCGAVITIKITDIYLNLSIDNPDCRTIDRKVPIGISFLGEGTMTVLSSFLYLQWLPL